MVKLTDKYRTDVALFRYGILALPAKDSSNEWCEPVSDEDYMKVGK